MGLVPTDLPQRLADAGLVVHVLDGWESRGSSANHRAVIFHWTASSANESPSSCANYVFFGATYAPDYNILVDRNGEVWLGAREKSNSSGEISHVARDEAFRGAVDWRSAASRGLGDDCSANAELWAVSAQNTGTGEPWSEALVHGMSVAVAVSLEALGLTRSTYTSHHAAATARKIDLTTGTGGCPNGDEWNRRISDELEGKGPDPPEVIEVWTVIAEVPPGTVHDPGTVVIGLPAMRKSARVDLWVNAPHSKGASLWGCQQYEGGAEGIGLWNSGYQWELWLPGMQRSYASADIAASTAAIALNNRSDDVGPVYVTISGT
jgi:hypothetical protein